MAPALLLVLVLIILFVWWRMMRYAFGLIDRAHDREREAESRNAGMNPVEEKAG